MTVIIGADTVVDLNGSIMEKPSDHADAKRMMRLLSGKTHSVHTGVVVMVQRGGDEAAKEARTFISSTRITFAELSERSNRVANGLRALGVKRAFDVPRGSADFSRIARRKPDDYLALSDVFHKTFIEVDEEGTEAAAATAITMVTLGMATTPPKPFEVRVDRPFLFAIQHRASGTCLFLGRIANPK